MTDIINNVTSGTFTFQAPANLYSAGGGRISYQARYVLCYESSTSTLSLLYVRLVTVSRLRPQAAYHKLLSDLGYGLTWRGAGRRARRTPVLRCPALSPLRRITDRGRRGR